MIEHKSLWYPRLRARYFMGLALKIFLVLGITTARAEVVSPEYFGLHIHNADNGTPWPQAPFGSWRLWDTHVQWTYLQPNKGAWNFVKLDGLVALAQTHKVSLLLPLGLSPRWASARPDEPSPYGEGRAAEPTSMEDWRVYVRTVAQRYKGKIDAYEIWNEPNSKDFFSGNSAKLVQLTCEAYRTLKAVDPSIIVVGPAYTGEQNVGKLEDFLSGGGGKCIDVVAYHLYVALSPPEAIPPLVKRIKQTMKRQGVEKLPLWNTETGWFIQNTDGTPERKVPHYWLRVRGEQSAAFVARSYLLGSAYGVDRFYWYAWDNNTLGLMEPTAKLLKPGGTAFGIVARWMIGGPRPSCTETNRMWLCKLTTKPDERRIVVWSPKISGLYIAPSGWRIQQVERADGRVEASHDAGTSLRVNAMPRRLILVPDTRSKLS